MKEEKVCAIRTLTGVTMAIDSNLSWSYSERAENF